MGARDFRGLSCGEGRVFGNPDFEFDLGSLAFSVEEEVGGLVEFEGDAETVVF